MPALKTREPKPAHEIDRLYIMELLESAQVNLEHKATKGRILPSNTDKEHQAWYRIWLSFLETQMKLLEDIDLNELNKMYRELMQHPIIIEQEQPRNQRRIGR